MPTQPLPDSLVVAPRGPLDAVVRVPGSKSLTNRALLVAALARGESELHGGLESDDTTVMLEALHAMGCPVDATGDPWTVPGRDGDLILPGRSLDMRNSGTSARFLTAASALGRGWVEIDGNPRMRERPISDLVDTLVQLGVHAEILGRGGCPPVRVDGGGMTGGEANIDARRSSQYVSAVLLAAPYAKRDVSLKLAGNTLVSRPYVDLTLDIMGAFGASAEWSGDASLLVRAGHGYHARSYTIEADASAAAYPFCAAAIAGGRVRVEGIPSASHQADFGLLELLGRMGCGIVHGEGFVEVTGPTDRLYGIDANLNDLPDAAVALAVVAAFACSPTHLRGLETLRIKETDRLAALETELRKLGASAFAGDDAIEIRPGTLRSAEIATYDDHRMAMAFSLAGLGPSEVTILDPACVSKTWPGYFQFLESL